jgi:hypothetical protein
VGYDIGMRIQAPFGGYSPSCYNGGCPGTSFLPTLSSLLTGNHPPPRADAMHYPADTSKIHAVGTGGTFVVTFC